MRTADLTIAGAGIIGAACALAAAEAGLRVVVVEPGPIGGGATAEGMGHLVQLDELPAEFALARQSLALWQTWADVPGAEFSRCGTLWVAEDDAGVRVLRAKSAHFHDAGIACEWLDPVALRAAEPALAHDLVAGLRVPEEGVVYPPRIARIMLDRVVARGGEVLQGRRVAALEAHGARLDDGTRIAGPVLVACGCATPALLPGIAVRPRRGHLVITDRYPGWLHHQVVETGYAAGAVGDADEAVACNVQPRPTGQVLVGSSREYGQDERAASRTLLARMLARCFRFFPELPRLRALRAWTGFRPASRDGLPYIGELPDRRGVWVATGHEGLGITTAPATARLFVDLFTGRTPALDPAPFTPSRSLA